MSQAAWEAMLADALCPQGVQPRELPAPQDHPYVLRRIRKTLQETRRGRRLWDITANRPAHTDSLLLKRRRTHTGSTGTTQSCSTPDTPRATQHDVPEPPASGPLT